MSTANTPFRRDAIVRIRGERWRVSRQFTHGDAAIVEVTGCDHGNRTAHARFIAPFETIESLPSTSSPRVVRPRVWRYAVRRLLAGAPPSPQSLRTALRADMTLLPFQLEPAIAVTHGFGCRLLIADEVGLGKTIQAGLIVAEILDRHPSAHMLVVCPAGIREQWRQELQQRFGLPSVVLDGAALARAAAQMTTAGNPWGVHPVVITSIDYVKRPEVLRSLEGLIWDAAIFDEAHTLTSGSDRRTAAAALAERAQVVALLTATPHGGDDTAFRRLCDIGNLRREFPLLMFRRTRLEAGIPGSRRTTWLRVIPTSAERDVHLVLMQYARRVWRQASGTAAPARLAIGVLVRRACSSAASLARSVERRLTLLDTHDGAMSSQLALPFELAVATDEAPDALLAARGLDDTDEERRWLLHILRLAQVASGAESKLAALGRFLARAREPAIVFTEYRDTLANVLTALSDIDAVQLHGGLTATERRDAARRFTFGDARLLLATDAASEGLNLHHRCRIVINLELPWTPLRLKQRIGRIDRIGQSRRVHALHLIAATTAEEKTVARLLQRTEHARTALTGWHREQMTHHDVAAAVIGRQSISGPLKQHLSDAFVDTVVPDLRAMATEEAERIAGARRLIAMPHVTPRTRHAHASASELSHRALGTRPLITSTRQRFGHSCVYSAFTLSFVDENGEPLWDALLGIAAPAPLALRTVAALREFFAHPDVDFDVVVEREQRLMLERLRGGSAPVLSLALHREKAIAERARERHAHMAADLLQGGLFDRRAQRAALAHSSALTEMLARHADRLHRLTRWHQLSLGARALAFGIVLK